MTYLHHSVPTIPHYCKPVWPFLRGVQLWFLTDPSLQSYSSLLNASLLFWFKTGIFLLSHCSTPFTVHLRKDEGDIIFYKNRDVKAVRSIRPSVVEEMKGKERWSWSLGMVLAMKSKKPTSRIGNLLFFFPKAFHLEIRRPWRRMDFFCISNLKLRVVTLVTKPYKNV